MMYGDRDDDPTHEDEGKFIPQKKLEQWWKAMQKKYPYIFTAEELCPPQQFQMGAKLTAFLDEDDPTLPTKILILGSMFKQDPTMGRCAMYIVKFEGKDELRTIHLSDVHEEGGWQEGWDVSPPLTNGGDGGDR